mmetsp:Transcript_104996/g.296694  ORF Transcript_104996/g.296694 Transcript_104996/m.296694 type:complete len:218 (-) Transcript_104996:1651-2304(-)
MPGRAIPLPTCWGPRKAAGGPLAAKPAGADWPICTPVPHMGCVPEPPCCSNRCSCCCCCMCRRAAGVWPMPRGRMAMGNCTEPGPLGRPPLIMPGVRGPGGRFQGATWTPPILGVCAAMLMLVKTTFCAALIATCCASGFPPLMPAPCSPIDETDIPPPICPSEPHPSWFSCCCDCCCCCCCICSCLSPEAPSAPIPLLKPPMAPGMVPPSIPTPAD